LNPWSETLASNLEEILFDAETLDKKTTELAEQITADYLRMGAEKILVVGILTGSVLFMADCRSRTMVLYARNDNSGLRIHQKI